MLTHALVIAASHCDGPRNEEKKRHEKIAITGRKTFRSVVGVIEGSPEEALFLQRELWGGE